MNTFIAQRDLSFLQSRGEMGQLTRHHNWAETPLGSPENWPQSLCTAVGIVLQSKFPMFLFWGPELVCFYNDAFRPSLGNEGKHPWALGKPGEKVWSEIWTVIKPWLDQVLTGGEAIWMENQLVGFYRNGKMEDIYWTFSYSPIPDESGKPGGVLVTCTETTDQVLNLHRIEESNDELLFAIEATELGTWDVDTKKGSLRSNKRLKEWFGLDDKQEVALSTAIDVIAGKDQQRVKDAIAKALQFESGGGYEIEYTVIHPVTKKERHVKAKGRAWFDDQKIAYRFNGTLQDITAQVIATNEIRETERKFRNTVHQVPVGITILRGPDFIVEMANETYLQLVDQKEAEFIGKPLFETLPEVKESVEGLLNNVWKTGIPFYGSEFPVTIKRYGKLETTYFNFAYTPLHENDGQVNGIAVVANEVTSLVEAKHTLAESEKQFRSMVTQSPISMAIFRGEDMIIEIANKVMFENIWRRKEADVLGKPLLAVFPEMESQRFITHLRTVYNTGKSFREKEAFAQVQGDDGLRAFYFDYEYSPLFEPDGTVSGLMVTVNDVTEKVKARQKIEEAEERARLAAESAELGTYEINMHTNEWNCTQRLATIFGINDITDRNRFIEVLHPDDLPVREKAYQKAYETGLLDFEARVIHGDGSIHWVGIKGRIYFDANGNPERQMGIAQDITDQKQFEQELARQVKERTAELENKNTELQRSNANLEEFAHAASHDLKEPVRKVHFFTDRLKSQLSDRLNEEERLTFRRIENSTKRMSTLIDDLLMYSHVSQQPYEKDQIDLNEKLAKVLEDLELDIQQKGAVIHKDHLPVIKGYRRQIQQLFQNLLSNAIKYAKDDQPPVIHISATTVKGKDVPVFLTEEEIDHDYYCISLKDNGIGFDQENSERIFLLFQRLHGRTEYPGTGIGLSIAKKVVENHSGKIIAYSKPGEGSTFNVYLPVS